MNDFVASSLDRLVTAWTTAPLTPLLRDLPEITRDYLLDTFD